jgi:tripartite ATP-independent transporter DctM subunit
MGLWMLLVLGFLTLTTGLPVWSLLVGVSSAFAVVGLVAGNLDVHSLTAMPARMIGLLESDLLQALPLYAFVGLLLQRLTAANVLFSVLQRIFAPWGCGTAHAALGLGAMVAPMNGSVASSSALLARLVMPRLEGMRRERAVAIVSAAATIGVVVPPSLVLILLGDTMMRAHTEASNLRGYVPGSGHIINTQDLFHAALLPAFAVVLLWAVAARLRGREAQATTATVSRADVALAVSLGGAIVLLLAGVFAGVLFAVEAAAAAGVVLAVSTAIRRALPWQQWKELLADTLVLSGALMALLAGATVFSLVFRLFGTDRWLSELMLASPFSPAATACLVLLLVGMCAWMLDAFEMIFVVIPIVAPPLIVMLGDAQQTGVLLLLVLQLSFLIPPMGYAVMMARARMGEVLSSRTLVLELLPFVLVQLCVVAAVFGVPGLVHQLDVPIVPVGQETEVDVEQQMRDMSQVSPIEAGATSGPEKPERQAGDSQSR